MKTIAAFTMALATLVLATAADADVQDRRCKGGMARYRGLISVRAGTPCLILPVYGMGHFTEIVEPPHEGTAVLRADGSIYYSPKPGFTGTDRLRVRRTNCDLRYSGYPYCGFGAAYVIFVE
jgi:hypothetical protein